MPTNNNNSGGATVVFGITLMLFVFMTIGVPLLAFGFAVYSCSEELTEFKGQILEEIHDAQKE